MTSRSRTRRTLHLLGISLAIGLVSLGLTATLVADTVTEEPTSESDEQRSWTGCRGAGEGPGAGGCGCRRGGDSASAGQGMGHGRGRGQGKGQAMGPRKGRGMGQGGPGRGAGRPGGGHQDVMEAIRALVHDYRQDIVREVEDIENGVATTTRAPGNPEAIAVLERHVGEMKDLIESGGRIRVWDPLFREIFDHYEEIEMAIEVLEDGVRVTETSANPEVVKLIRAHARKVNEFVAHGPDAVHQPTALPDGYLGRE